MNFILNFIFLRHNEHDSFPWVRAAGKHPKKFLGTNRIRTLGIFDMMKPNINYGF